ncbi:MAG: N-acetylglucosaminyl-diphospho-decaprenol L-rhamnosyltransferase [Actinobacteria bacterium]|nr:N-acetylglucosaminyl-diphospho-decaprenol L-rhamnosyltransferase [Actinomycetota bacterium]
MVGKRLIIMTKQTANIYPGASPLTLPIASWRRCASRKLDYLTWRREYNEVRPHRSLGYMTPAEFTRLQGPPGLTAVPGVVSALQAACYRRPALPVRGHSRQSGIGRLRRLLCGADRPVEALRPMTDGSAAPTAEGALAPVTKGRARPVPGLGPSVTPKLEGIQKIKVGIRGQGSGLGQAGTPRGVQGRTAGVRGRVTTCPHFACMTRRQSNSSIRQQPLVYIILLNWRGWRDTVRCIESLRSLRYPGVFEIVVLDNASTDDSVDRIREQYPDVTLIETGGNLGFAKGNNVGIRYAIQQKADYIWLLNNDTIVEPQALEALVEVAERDSGIGMVGSVLHYMHAPERIQAWGGGQVSLTWGTVLNHTQPVESRKLSYLAGASMLIKRAVIEHIGCLDEGFFMYWEDIDYCFRLRKAGWGLAVAAESRVFHKESSSVGGRSPTRDRLAGESAVRFFGRHAPVPILPLLLGTVIRVGKRLLEGKVRHAWAVVLGVSKGVWGWWPRNS